AARPLDLPKLGPDLLEELANADAPPALGRDRAPLPSLLRTVGGRRLLALHRSLCLTVHAVPCPGRTTAEGGKPLIILQSARPLSMRSGPRRWGLRRPPRPPRSDRSASRRGRRTGRTV